MDDLTSWWAMARDAGWTAAATGWAVRLGLALLAMVIGVRLVRWIARGAERGLTRAAVEPTAVVFLRKVTHVILLVVLGLAVLQGIFGVAPTSLIAVLGAAGLAIGLALKDSLSNVAAGVMLVTLKPFRVGDVVEVGGKTGKVETVSIFQTVLRGSDNQTIVLPNSKVTTDAVINLTPGSMRRVELVIGIGYADSIDDAREVVMDIMRADARILAEPPPDVLVYELAESSVNLGIRCHVANADWFAVKTALTEAIKKAFDRGGISIPFPQRDVRMSHQLLEKGLEARSGYRLVAIPDGDEPGS